MMEADRLLVAYNKHDYGHVLRTSGIFYFKKDQFFKTTISILDYWKLKRNLHVTIQATLRKMDGSIVKQDNLNFKEGNVINYSPNIVDHFFEGSLEIEIFSLEDMVVPYAGIISVYESKYGISMVHTYGRTYSNQEIEEKKILPKGEESCCNAFKDSVDTESFVIVHNGNRVCPEQVVHISILNHKGQRRESSFLLHQLSPYETVKIRPRDYFTNLIEFLDGKPGFSSFSFSLNESAFPRMLGVNQKIDSSDFQVTHSNFNLAKHKTSKLEEGKLAYMFVPRITQTKEEVVIYPDCDPGNYKVETKSGTASHFNENKAAIVPINGTDSELLTFRKENDSIPTRIHTGIRLSRSPSRITAETCLGVYHESTPPKRFFWGICANTPECKSQIFFQQFQWGEELKRKSPVTIKLYSEKTHQFKETSISPSELQNGKYLSDIFENVDEFLGAGFGWFTLFSEYPHGVAFSTLENQHGSISFEHGM